mmetsp:Transcript_25045/g.41740  ORF Transcript_25045/g.41740 Transcript_25045/m.41740 type:complete len:208 (-) Transcript_25045:1299-1922(-)
MKKNQVGQAVIPPTPRKSRVWFGRALFLCFLCIIAGVCGYLAMFYLSASETKVAESQFESIAEQSLLNARNAMYRKTMGGATLSAMFESYYPDASQWPLVYSPGFINIAERLGQTVDLAAMGFAPIVRPDQLAAFEEYVYAHLPSGVGESSFGRGIYGVDPNNGAVDHRFHDVNGTTSYESPYDILVPIVHMSSTFVIVLCHVQLAQ